MSKHIRYGLGTLAILAIFHSTTYAMDPITGSINLGDYATLGYSTNFACVKEGSTCYYCGSESSCSSLGCATKVQVNTGDYQTIGTSTSAIGCLGNIFCMAPQNTLIVPENTTNNTGRIIYNYFAQPGRHCYVDARADMCSNWNTTPEMIDGRPYCKCRSLPNYMINDAPCSLCEKNYYKSDSETDKCTHCPSFGNIEAETYGINPFGITQCYLPENSTDSDETGTFTITSECFYKNN